MTSILEAWEALAGAGLSCELGLSGFGLVLFKCTDRVHATLWELDWSVTGELLLLSSVPMI
jgi:hypothetical protein